MKTIYQFCNATGRKLSRILNRLISSLTHKGKLSISISLSVPLIAKIEVGYTAEIENRKPDDA